MGEVTITKMDSTNDLTKCIEDIHLDFLESIEAAYEVTMSEIFWEKMQNPNLAYLNFEGTINGRDRTVIYLAHSSINKYKAKEPITAYLNEVYEYIPTNERYKSGNVSRSNRTLAFDLNDIVQESKSNVAWNREVDSESKLLEKFLEDLDEGIEDLNGELLVYTFYYPCLSCSNKIVKVITELSKRFPNLNIDVLYVEEYGNGM